MSLPLRWRGRSMKPTGCCVAGRSTMKRPMCAAQFATTTTLRTATITIGFRVGFAPLRSTPEWALSSRTTEFRRRCNAVQGLPESCTAEVWRRSTTCSWPRRVDTWPGQPEHTGPPRPLPLPRLGRGNLLPTTTTKSRSPGHRRGLFVATTSEVHCGRPSPASRMPALPPPPNSRLSAAVDGYVRGASGLGAAVRPFGFLLSNSLPGKQRHLLELGARSKTRNPKGLQRGMRPIVSCRLTVLTNPPC